MENIIIKQIRSGIDKSYKQKRTLVALGLRKMNASVIHQATPQIMGMLKRVENLVVWEVVA